MHLGLHFEIADTPPLISEEITEKSEIYQDLAKSENLSLWLMPKVQVHKLLKMELFMK